jgi:phospholipid-binding lipoprotein MlaA
MVLRTKQAFLTLTLLSTLMISACASSRADAEYGDVYDPWEPYNRAVFAFNDGLDAVVLNPVTDVYRFVVPDAFRGAITNFLNNLKHPLYAINDVLQGDFEGAGVATQRFVFNTFTGFGGVLDTASWEGITYEPEDFGQTLAVWGLEPGPYFVLPLLGPSSVRDTFGIAGDMALDPVNWYLWEEHKDDLATGLTVAGVLSTKDQFIDLQRDLKADSLDYYAAARSVWMQRRNALITDGDMSESYAVEYDAYK